MLRCLFGEARRRSRRALSYSRDSLLEARMEGERFLTGSGSDDATLYDS